MNKRENIEFHDFSYDHLQMVYEEKVILDTQNDPKMFVGERERESELINSLSESF